VSNEHEELHGKIEEKKSVIDKKVISSSEGKKVKWKKEEKAKKVKEKARKADEYFDQLLRLKAEFDNYRKRMNREKEEFAKYAAEELICEFLAVVDHLESAISVSEKSKDFDALLQGVEMTRKEAVRILNKWGLEEIAAVGEKFDPEKHDAIMSVDSDKEEGKIVDECRKGYCLKGKLVRPSMVKVARRIKNG